MHHRPKHSGASDQELDELLEISDLKWLDRMSICHKSSHYKFARPYNRILNQRICHRMFDLSHSDTCQFVQLHSRKFLCIGIQCSCSAGCKSNFRKTLLRIVMSHPFLASRCTAYHRDYHGFYNSIPFLLHLHATWY